MGMTDSPDTTLEATDGTTDKAVEEKPTVTAKKTVQQDEDYEKRFKGLQRANQKLKAEHDKLAEEYDDANAALEEMRQAEKSSEGKAKTLEDQLAKLESEKSDLESEIASQQKRQERMNLILTDYKDLAEFEARGLLPETDGTPEGMKEKFDSFRDALGTTVDTEVNSKLKGIGTKAVGDTQVAPRDIATVRAELEAVAGQDDPESRAKFRVLQKEWDELHQEED